MDVGMIYQVGEKPSSGRKMIQVVEWPEGKLGDDVIKAWLQSQGYEPTTSRCCLYQIDFCPVTSWEEIHRAGIAFCDQQWVIMALGLQSHENGQPLYWNNGGWVQRVSAEVFDGYKRQNGDMKSPGPHKWVYIGP